MHKITFLNNLTPQQFLSKYWQKKPLLIRQAFPGFKNFLSKEKLIKLSCQDEVESRLVTSNNNEWELSLGPFQKSEFKSISCNWTLLVQGINHYFQEAQDLLKHFNFIPAARLDDLMVSFATDGSGVGPHLDSYDVFLLQGYGKRLWQISSQKKYVLDPNAPLKIITNFKATKKWILEPGDMLYLPPQYAHNGIAIGDCMTYSIGFRSPHYQELIGRFFEYLDEQNKVKGIYADPDLKFSKNTAQIPSAMIRQVAEVLKKIRFNQKDIEVFLGNYLTEPKANIIFDSPQSPINKSTFLNRAIKQGIALDLKTQMLFTKNKLFMNGEVFMHQDKILNTLANNREIIFKGKPSNLLATLLYEWYLAGYIIIKS